jgi:hypothetical protein
MLAACSSDSGAAASSEKTEEEITEPEQIEENSDAAAETDLVQSLVQRAAEGMTMHVTVYADGEEMYSYDYAMLGQKYCIDRIGGIHNDHYDYDICRIVFNPDLYELPVLWYGAPEATASLKLPNSIRIPPSCGILIISRKRETWNLKVKRITSRNSAAPH